MLGSAGSLVARVEGADELQRCLSFVEQDVWFW